MTELKVRNPLLESLTTASALGAPLVYLCPRRKRSFRVSFEAFEDKLNITPGMPWLIIDGVRTQNIDQVVFQKATNSFRLFPDGTDEELLEVSPVILEFSDVQELLDIWPHLWGFGIASFLFSSAEPELLLSQLRTSLYVEDAEGEICILRFFDPRVLCRLTELLSAEQLNALLGDVIHCFLFEGTDGELMSLERKTDLWETGR